MSSSSSSTNVAVAVRCRPISSKETGLGSKCAVLVDDKAQSITVVGGGGGGAEEKTFTFDLVYPGETPQPPIYEDIGAPLITKALEGFNGTVFAYGQTGSGKTHTMMGVLGDKELEGIVPRLTEDLFCRVMRTIEEKGGALGDAEYEYEEEEEKKEAVRFMITVSFLEIYNEVIHDLLNPQSNKVLKIREHPDMGIYVESLCELAVKTPGDIFRLIDQGNRVRRVASTAMNERSSRSHSVFTLNIQQKATKEIEAGVERETALSSKLNLVDLAGSERADKTGAEGSTLREGAAINQSLMALGGVINALSENAAFVPYRNSKLTRLLQESLGGNARTVMVANVSPADYNLEETLGTLRYASRAKKIQNKVVRNEDVHERVIRELQEEIDRLRTELAAATRETVGVEQEAELEARVAQARAAEAALQERIANMEYAKEEEWAERERLTAELEEERKNNLNRAVRDVVSSVKQEKLALITRVRELQDKRAAKQKELGDLKDTYKSSKKDLESAMISYEQKQIAHDKLDRSAPTFDASADELLRLLTDLEARRARVVEIRAQVGVSKTAVNDLEKEITATRAELAAAASTIAENDRLRAAIQEEERLAFQSQRDAYLNEQLAAEKTKLEKRRRELSRRESTMNEAAEASAVALADAAKRADLLTQELDMYKSERDHLKQQLELLHSDLDHARGDCHKLEEELRETADRLAKAEFEVENERGKTENLKQELWERQEHGDELVDQLAAKDKELRAMERVALDHKEHVRRDRVDKANEAKKQRRALAPPDHHHHHHPLPGVAEAKVSSSGNDDHFLTDSRRGVTARDGDDDDDDDYSVLVSKNDAADLEHTVARLRAENRQLERDAKEDAFSVFKGLMDVTTKDRLALTAQRDELQHLLKQSVQDIIHLQRLNDEYKRELDLRRSLDCDHL
ncbi:hypothetical protein CTAYLR_000634 [Chrysophaeum taylorii]|uniref:Kinesin-like protein n=1 Tax=Chrysophaeum taylorii TaxID=2483200 RepID=A0AAD7XLC0_9STRA|nr:hypothetical protein CTAYLR_000634 [Chrysophaeum taylorii]